MTPTQEGPPTLRKMRDYLLDAMETAKSTAGFLPKHHIPEDSKLGKWTNAIDRLTDEALELDEKRRAAMEKVLSKARNLGCDHELEDLNGVEPWVDVSGHDELIEAIIEADALTPTPDKKGE